MTPNARVRAGTNLAAVRGFNMGVVLEAVRQAPGGISRVELAGRVGLSAQTISNVCSRLLDHNLIVEIGTQKSGIGKPRRILKLRADGRFAIGIHLDPALVTVVLLNLAGAVVASRTLTTAPAPHVDETIERIVLAVETVIATTQVDTALILGAGIAAPGPIDFREGSLANPPLLPSWDGVRLRGLLADRLKIPVLLEKDVTAAVVGETWANQGGNDFIFFYYGTGVGVGIAFNNAVVRGLNGNAGEVGKLAIGTDANIVRRLGPAIGPRTVVRRAAELGVLARVENPLDFAAVQAAFETLALRARQGDIASMKIVDELAHDISAALVALVDLLDVDRVVFGGPYWFPVANILLPRVAEIVTTSPELAYPHPISFDEASIGPDVAAAGAACIVLHNALWPVTKIDAGS